MIRVTACSPKEGCSMSDYGEKLLQDQRDREHKELSVAAERVASTQRISVLFCAAISALGVGAVLLGWRSLSIEEHIVAAAVATVLGVGVIISYLAYKWQVEAAYLRLAILRLEAHIRERR
jgi:hypothetical protein